MDFSKWFSLLLVATAVMLAAVVAVLVFPFGQNTPETEASNTIWMEAETFPDAESAATSGFVKADIPNYIELPRDHGAHPDFQAEWWYYTGNLQDEEGHEYGFQFTIFRNALAPGDPADDKSDWRTHQFYAAHVAVIDDENNIFAHDSRFSRGTGAPTTPADSLAGATGDPYTVWLDDWSVMEQADGSYRMVAKFGEHEIDFLMNETRPPIIHGADGISTKGGEGEASYYYSLVGLDTAGTLTIAGETYEVTGDSWFDHEFMTNFLPSGAVGWDWFAVQFDNDEALMFFNIRNADGSIVTTPEGTWINADSTTEPLSMDDVQIAVLDEWESDETGTVYPSKWRLTSEKLGMEMVVTPLVNDAELIANGLVYWEGAARYEGVLHGETMSGRGYVELTGYDKAFSVFGLQE